MYYGARRGRQNVREMKKDSYIIRVDATGREFITQNKGEMDKNHDANDGAYDTTGEGAIYATGGKKCPVRCFRTYLLHLNPNLDCLWQKPRTKISMVDHIWYCNSPMGEKTLGKMLGVMSMKYKLSVRYTNHCLRVTSMQVMDDAGVSARHIQRVSGHKSLDSVSNYARRLSTVKKRNISHLLSAATSIVDEQEACPPMKICRNDTAMLVNPRLDIRADPVHRNAHQQNQQQHDQNSSIGVEHENVQQQQQQQHDQNSSIGVEHENVQQQQQQRLREKYTSKNEDIIDFSATRMADPIDTIMANIPHQYLTQVGSIPRLFAPVMNNCSNITFNVHIYPPGAPQ